ncbi:MAG: DUF6498-containing protein, partial [archaeon]
NNSSFWNYFDLKTKFSIWSLIIVNLFVIILAIVERWNFHTCLVIYWFQSIIIGIFCFIRILSLKEFSTDGFRTIKVKRINSFSLNFKLKKSDFTATGVGRPPETTKTKIETAFFFLFHYGFFQFAYYLSIVKKSPIIFDKVIIFAIILFFINHLISYIYNYYKTINQKPKIGELMFKPYQRIFPMHFIMIFGSSFSNSFALVIFLILKAIADVTMHILENYKDIRNREV